MKLVRIVLAVALIAALGLGATACGNGDVAALVNGEKIKNSELNTQLDQIKSQYPDMFSGADGEARLADFKKRLLDQLIDQRLVTQAAKEKGITITDADVDKQINQLKQGFKGDKEFQAALKNAGMTEDALRKQVRDQLLSQKLVESISKEAKVSKADVAAYYKKNKSQFNQQAAKRASHILFDKGDKATAQKVLAQVKSGSASEFVALAKKYSKDPGSAEKGGDLGWPTTPYVPEFQKALDGLKKGQISGLVKSEFGWHIIKVTDTRGSKQLTLKEATRQIEEILAQQQKMDDYQKFLDKLRKSAKIEIIAKDLKSDGAQAGDKTKPSVPAQQQTPGQ